MLLSGMRKFAFCRQKMAICGLRTGAPGMCSATALAPWRRIKDAAMPQNARFTRKMSVDDDTVRHIARLARLAIGDADLAGVAVELSRVLELADALKSADVGGVEPMAHPHEQVLAWRADAVTESDRADQLLALAPEARGGFYLVPKVIE
jgi:aspartyl-tRNA(Asn)/glutamyl-tRNA(Gln) amidotransferase subunit C